MRKWIFNNSAAWLRNKYLTEAIKNFFNTKYYARLYLNNGDFKLLFDLWIESAEEYVVDVLAAYLKDAGIDFEDKIYNPEDYFYKELIQYI